MHMKRTYLVEDMWMHNVPKTIAGKLHCMNMVTFYCNDVIPTPF